MRSAVATAAALAAFAGLAAAASAQAQPASPGATPAPTTGTTPTNQTNNPSSTAGNSVGHLPVIDIVPWLTFPAYYYSTAQLKGYDYMDLGGTFKVPITKQLSVSFDRLVGGTLDQPTVGNAGPTAANPIGAGVNSHDVILVERADYAINQFTVEVGESFRHRIWAGGAVLHTTISAQPYPYTLASVEHHYGYLGLTYATKPDKYFLGGTNFVFNITGDAQNVDHHVATLCTAGMVTAHENLCTTAGTVGYHDENPGTDRYYETTQSVAMNIPLRPTTTLTFKDAWGALNFYENAPFPYRWSSAFTAQITKRFSPIFSLSMSHQDYHQIPQGAPDPYPNAIHVGAWNVFADFHLDLNQMIH
ncbi:MAG TPA: hypothetical protein VFB22_15920 [Candidatus Baltobacteraceae bacterium]|nr:hypothetical protein [Candidatus Baltobacteraceae bacterium]